MTIEKGTNIGRRNGPEVDGVQGYDWFKYCTEELRRIVSAGDHKPTVDKLLEAGCMVEVPAIYDPATHKLIPGSFSDDGINITQNTEPKTAEELASDIAANEEAAEIQAQEEILALKADSVDLVRWIGATNAQIDTKVESKFPDVGQQTVLKEICYALRDTAEVFKALYKTGRI